MSSWGPQSPKVGADAASTVKPLQEAAEGGGAVQAPLTTLPFPHFLSRIPQSRSNSFMVFVVVLKFFFMSSCAYTSFPVSTLFFCYLFLLFHGLHHPSVGDVALAKFQRQAPTPRCSRKTLVHDHFNHTHEAPKACWRRVFPGLGRSILVSS